MWGRIPTSLSTPVTSTLSNIRTGTLKTPLSLHTNRLARQTPSSAVLTTPNTTILATLSPAPPTAPLLIDFRAKAAAVGIIPGTWTRREQRPALRETLITRLIDRSLRPVCKPAHITVSVLAAKKDSDVSIDALAANAAAAAFAGVDYDVTHVAAARVALLDGQFIPFPGDLVNDNADLSLFVAVDDKERLLTISLDHAHHPISENIVIDGIAEAIKAASRIIPIQKHFREQILELRHREGYSSYPRNIPTREIEKPIPDEKDLEKVYHEAKTAYERAFVTCREFPGKAHRAKVVTDAQQHIIDQFPDLDLDAILSVANRAARDAHRQVVLRDGLRIDGRRYDQVRPIRAEASILPGDVHGSAIFERGDTQVLACSTIGLKRQAIRTEEYVDGGENRPFFVHYSFPPFATGDYGRFGGFSSRREIGHSALTESAIEPMLNVNDKDYPYALRVSAEVLGSDGSSSMATVCAGSLALLDAGVPLKEPVAGVAMGLLSKNDSADQTEEDDVILTDILGAEDHFGEMDMKVTGTKDGITACQLDIKRPHGLALATIERTFEKAKMARMSILEEMKKVELDEPREMPKHAPRVAVVPVNPLVAIQTMMKDRATGLREIETATEANLTFDGQKETITIEAPNVPSLELAKKLIALKMNDLEIGTKLQATISEVKRSYAVAELSSGGVSGILHVSKMQINPMQGASGHESNGLSGFRYPDAGNFVSLGDTVEVVVLESDRGRNILRLGLVSPPRKVSKGDLEREIDSVLIAANGER